MRTIHHIGITVSDLERSAEFYHRVLGLEFALAPTPWFEGGNLARGLGVRDPAALRIVMFKIGAGETVLELLQYREPPSETTQALAQNNVGAAHIAFLVDDIRATYSELVGEGVVFNSEVNVIDDGPLAGWRWVYFKDPDGHTLELVEVAYVNESQRAADLRTYLEAIT